MITIQHLTVKIITKPTGEGNLEDIKVPDTIQGIIATRMDMLDDNLKRTP